MAKKKASKPTYFAALCKTLLNPKNVPSVLNCLGGLFNFLSRFLD